MKRAKRDWTGLPEDILVIIAKRLQNYSLDNLLRFGAVCRSFRSSFSIVFPPKTPIPHSAFSNIFFSGDSTHGNGCNFFITESTIYAIESLDNYSDPHETARTWVVKIEESDSGKVRIRDPLGGFRFQNLSVKRRLPKSLNLVDYRVKEVTKTYQLESVTEIYNKEPTYFKKVVVSESLDEVMAIHPQTEQLVMWRKEDQKWCYIDTNLDQIQDILYHNKQFYALGYKGRTIAVDSKSLRVTNMAARSRSVSGYEKYLVKSGKDLFLMVIRYLKLGVYRLDGKKRKWVPSMNGLEDKVLFLGDDCSFAISAEEFSGYKGKFIFSNCKSLRLFCCNDPKLPAEYPGRDALVFKLEDGTYTLKSFSNHSKIFWPPPKWLKQQYHNHDPLSRILRPPPACLPRETSLLRQQSSSAPPPPYHPRD